MAARDELQKFTREWKGKVRVDRVTMGDGSSHFTAAYKHTKADTFVTLEMNDSSTGQRVPARYDSAVAAMEAAQRQYKLKQAEQVVSTFSVFP